MKERQAAEYREWLDSNLNLIKTAQSLNELQKVYASSIRKLELRKDNDNKVKFTRAKDQRKDELSAPQEKAE
ncbi:hypothetical protein D9M71_703890 [compost metagenome]